MISRFHGKPPSAAAVKSEEHFPSSLIFHNDGREPQEEIFVGAWRGIKRGPQVDESFGLSAHRGKRDGAEQADLVLSKMGLAGHFFKSERAFGPVVILIPFVPNAHQRER